MDNDEKYRIGKKVSKISIILNIFLSFVKILLGLIGTSSAMVADGIHSLSDVLSSFIVIIGLKMSKKPDDEDHPYGHEKMEPVMTKMLAVILFITAVMLGYEGIKNIIYKEFVLPERITLYGAVISIVLKEWMYRFTVKAGKRINSSSLIADAWHHRSDAFSSICTFIGIVGARDGLLILDPIASIIICVFIGKVAVSIYLKAVKQLVDHAASKEVIKSIEREIMKINGVIKIDELKTRIHADRLYVDVEISVKSDLLLVESHDIAENVHETIENSNDMIKHCMVHVNPQMDK